MSKDIFETRQECVKVWRKQGTLPRSMREQRLVREAVVQGGQEFGRGFREGYEFAMQQYMGGQQQKRLK